MFRFGTVGLAATAIDFVSYTLLSLLLPSWIAKSIGFATGTITGFFLNRAWAFRYRGPLSEALIKYLLLYVASLFVNVLVNQTFLILLFNMEGAKFIAFTVATLVTATINYLFINNFMFNSGTK
jgi:putative flippase GtrA